MINFQSFKDFQKLCKIHQICIVWTLNFVLYDTYVCVFTSIYHSFEFPEVVH